MTSRAKRFWISGGGAVLIAVGTAFSVWWLSSSRQDDAPVAAVEQVHGVQVHGVQVHGVQVHEMQVLEIWIDAWRPLAIRQPLEVAAIGDHGEKGLCCVLSGAVALEDDGGDAVYRFHVPGAGRYRLWGSCRWLEAEGDGFAVEIGGVQSIVHKTASTEQWQWLPLAEAPLSAGVATMTLTTKDGGFAVRRMFLCNNLDRNPTDSSIEPLDVFFDDFDGCEEGEFDSWSVVSGKWKVDRRPDDTRPASQMLVGKSSSEAMVSVGSPDWRDYSIVLNCRTVSSSRRARVAVRFYCDQEGNGLVLRWTSQDADGPVRMELLREESTGVQTIDRFDAAWNASRWSELSIEAREGTLRISIDSQPVRTIKTGTLGSGGVGLWLSGDVEVMFDNIQITGWRPQNLPPRDKEVSTHDDQDHQ